MAGCCGGKNAGKPISFSRYLLGLAFFSTYHLGVHTVLRAASLANSRLAPVRDFHAHYFSHLLQETLRRDGITLPGKNIDKCALE